LNGKLIAVLLLVLVGVLVYQNNPSAHQSVVSVQQAAQSIQWQISSQISNIAAPSTSGSVTSYGWVGTTTSSSSVSTMSTISSTIISSFTSSSRSTTSTGIWFGLFRQLILCDGSCTSRTYLVVGDETYVLIFAGVEEGSVPAGLHDGDTISVTGVLDHDTIFVESWRVNNFYP